MEALRLGVVDTGVRFGAELVGFLGREGIAADLHQDAEILLDRLSSSPPSLVVVNGGGLPGDVLDTVRRIRTVSRIPCVVVGEEAADPERSVGVLEAGADDLMDRATPMRTMLARMRAVLRRGAWGLAGEDAAAPGWRLLRERRELRRPDGAGCNLTTAEFDLFCLLVAAGPSPVSREAICRDVFRRRWRAEDRTVDNLVVRLRRKLDDPNRTAVRTVQGRGYTFVGFEGAALRLG